jgi:ribosomal protein S18 acetylase RimI-like enzyme
MTMSSSTLRPARGAFPPHPPARSARPRSAAAGIPLALPDWTIRSATERDIARVLALWRIAGGTPTVGETREALSRLLAADRDALLLAESGGALIGSLIAAWDGWRGSFYRLAVHPERRRQGLAGAMLREGERRLRERGALRLTAIVIDEDRAAMGFWTAAGYERQERRARFVRPRDA